MLAPFRDIDGGAIASGSGRLGPPLVCQKRHERDVATQGFAKRILVTFSDSCTCKGFKLLNEKCDQCM